MGARPDTGAKERFRETERALNFPNVVGTT